MYVNYTPAAPMPMGPPAVGATPPQVTGSSLFSAYTDGMSPAEVTRFKACMHAKVAAAGDGVTRNTYYAECRDQVWGVTAAPTAGSGLPSWALYAGVGAAAFLLVRLLTK